MFQNDPLFCIILFQFANFLKARRAVTLQTIPETTDDQPTNLAPQIEEGECVSVLEIPQTAG